jgi:hypothetical protein
MRIRIAERPPNTAVITLSEIGTRAIPLPNRASEIPANAVNTRMMFTQSL